MIPIVFLLLHHMSNINSESANQRLTEAFIDIIKNITLELRTEERIRGEVHCKGEHCVYIRVVACLVGLCLDIGHGLGFLRRQ